MPKKLSANFDFRDSTHIIKAKLHSHSSQYDPWPTTCHKLYTHISTLLLARPVCPRSRWNYSWVSTVAVWSHCLYEINQVLALQMKGEWKRRLCEDSGFSPALLSTFACTTRTQMAQRDQSFQITPKWNEHESTFEPNPKSESDFLTKN